MAKKIVLVTGANQGLGYCIISVAAKRDPSAHFILASRDADKGVTAIEQLKKENTNVSIESLQLDVTDDQQILEAVDAVTRAHGKIDVLVNNAGIAKIPTDQSLSVLRAAYRDTLDTNVSSLACVTAGFKPLLAKATQPKVINITSGLASITNCLARKMPRAPFYASSKTAVNGLTAQFQAMENDLHAQGATQNTVSGDSKINYYAVAPGFLKTAFTGFSEHGRDPILGAEVVVQLIMSDTYPGGTQWEFENGKMQEIPW